MRAPRGLGTRCKHVAVAAARPHIDTLTSPTNFRRVAAGIGRKRPGRERGLQPRREAELVPLQCSDDNL